MFARVFALLTVVTLVAGCARDSPIASPITDPAVKETGPPQTNPSK